MPNPTPNIGFPAMTGNDATSAAFLFDAEPVGSNFDLKIDASLVLYPSGKTEINRIKSRKAITTTLKKFFLFKVLKRKTIRTVVREIKPALEYV